MLPSKGYVAPPPAIETALDRPDPNLPHPFLPSYPRSEFEEEAGGCRACGASPRLPLHLEPIGGWKRCEHGRLVTAYCARCSL